MTDGRCRFGPRAKREMVVRLLAGESARAVARELTIGGRELTAEHGDGGAGSLAGSRRG